ncbi:hypothetical protein [Rhizobium sp. PP-F2F-G48]|uniref:hypothetical protein n=1 Tax=Rhizobium sp. PP-F2F-G48 TaxID=2135651 RepID=UPI001046D95D|nr:hypothetical protein [Rhizobium sp. PP-F2F-G48]
MTPPHRLARHPCPITYERNCPANEGYNACHLTLSSEVPARCPLPLTKTGYLSHFTDPALIDEAGGPVAFVTAAIDEAAEKQAWKAYEQESRQMALSKITPFIHFKIYPLHCDQNTDRIPAPLNFNSVYKLQFSIGDSFVSHSKTEI